MKIQQIRWVDSSSEEGWCTFTYKRVENITCETVGYLFSEDAETVTMTSCISSFQQPRSPITIPKVSIVSRTDVEIKAATHTKAATPIKVRKSPRAKGKAKASSRRRPNM